MLPVSDAALFEMDGLLIDTAELLQLGHRVCSSLHEVLTILKSGQFQFSCARGD